MIIELHGAGFSNRGSELMIRASVSALSRRIPSASFVLDPLRGPFETRAKIGLLQLLPPRGPAGGQFYRWGLRLQAISQWVPSKLKSIARRYGCVTFDKVDVVIDIAGFAYTEEWGQQPIKDLNALAHASIGRTERPLVLLPQAFGPFESPESRRAMQSVLDQADQVWARDDTSRAYLHDVGGEGIDIRMAPDITFSCDFGLPTRRSSIKADASVQSVQVCVVPNYRLMDQGRATWGGRYLDLLASLIEHVKSFGAHLILVEHDASGEDRIIIEELQSRVASSLDEVILGKEAVELKRILGESRFVIASRYHALVGALAGGVPVLSIGWSHKYQELLTSFGCGRFAIRPEEQFSAVRSKVHHLWERDTNLSLRHHIVSHLDSVQERHSLMWNEVAELAISATDANVAGKREQKCQAI